MNSGIEGKVTEKVVKRGRVLELPVNGKPCLHLDNGSGIGLPIEGILIPQEIFMPYLGKLISITVEQEKGKVRKITITEET